MFDSQAIRFVLVGTTHPGNIGAAARAMKTMGLKNLYLVAPKIYPSVEATARASGADDVLANAVVHDDLQSALNGCRHVYALSARLRHLAMPVKNPREAVSDMQRFSAESPLAVVFGREHSGLSNDEIDQCQTLIHIPANPDYSSLNLAAAVQVMAYEIRMAEKPQVEAGRVGEQREAVTADDMAHLYEHFERALLRIGFLDPDNPRNLMRRIRRLFNRAEMDRNEVHILHGILRAAETQARSQSE